MLKRGNAKWMVAALVGCAVMGASLESRACDGGKKGGDTKLSSWFDQQRQLTDGNVNTAPSKR